MKFYARCPEFSEVFATPNRFFNRTRCDIGALSSRSWPAPVKKALTLLLEAPGARPQPTVKNDSDPFSLAVARLIAWHLACARGVLQGVQGIDAYI